MSDTNMSIVAGDSDEWIATVYDNQDPPEPVNLNAAVDGEIGRAAIVRFAVKLRPQSETNADALIFKASYDASEIEILDQSEEATLGQYRVYVDKADTEGATPGTYTWDVEVSRQDFLRTDTGTISVTTASTAVVGVGTQFTRARVGDILQVMEGANTTPVIITAITNDTSLTVESAIFTTDPGVTFEIRRGDHKTVARGSYCISRGVVRD